jgi:hypothetical protein
MSSPSTILSRQVLDMRVRVRLARLAEPEAKMIAACEAAAGGMRPRSDAGFVREHSDRATWQRDLAAAMRLEAEFGPPMRRFRQEIGQLERLITLQIAT